MFLSHSMEKQNIKPGDIRNYKIKSFFYSLPSITNTHTHTHIRTLLSKAEFIYKMFMK